MALPRGTSLHVGIDNFWDQAYAYPGKGHSSGHTVRREDRPEAERVVMYRNWVDAGYADVLRQREHVRGEPDAPLLGLAVVVERIEEV